MHLEESMEVNSMGKTLIVDVETTGLPPRNIPPWKSSAWNQCRIVQIAWQVRNGDGSIACASNFIIRPDGFTIPVESTNIHGITNEHALATGVPIEQAFYELEQLLPGIECIVAHNIAFDDPVIQSEIIRTRNNPLLTHWKEKAKYCTMKMATVPGQKWPKLIELYEKCFGKKPDGVMHTADADVQACAEIYFHVMNQEKAT